MPNNIDIAAGLNQTMASGPGAIQLPQLQMNQHALPQGIGEQLRALRASFGGQTQNPHYGHGGIGLRGGVKYHQPMYGLPQSQPMASGLPSVQPAAPVYEPPKPMDVVFAGSQPTMSFMDKPPTQWQQEQIANQLRPVKRRAGFFGGSGGSEDKE